MDTRLLFLSLSIAAIASIAAVGVASTTKAVSHADGASANMTDSNNETMTAQEEHNATSTVVGDSLFVDLAGKVLPANDFLHLYERSRGY